LLLTFQISAGELAGSASELEEKLSRIFQIAKHWNALLLLDEADVYMERRCPRDVHRNGLVSVFLRKLEYCEGIMFLTTNRVSEFDDAILSRIHIMLRYNDLDVNARKTIWKQFLDIASQGSTVISPGEINRLVANKLNGRQVCFLIY
jgi:SpoVK/Ycf46/Vps4 family AAA+-type ATPase